MAAIFSFFLFSLTAHGAKPCIIAIQAGATPYGQVLKNFNLALNDYNQKQEDLFSEIDQALRIRSSDSRKPGNEVIPFPKKSTVNLLKRWGTEISPYNRFQLLRSSIMHDPYLIWIMRFGKDWSTEHAKLYSDLDLSSTPTLDGINKPVLSTKGIGFEDFFNIHLIYDGPMLLPPEYFVLRLARDMDPQLTSEMHEQISALLDIQRIKYFLEKQLKELATNHGAEDTGDNIKLIDETIDSRNYLPASLSDEEMNSQEYEDMLKAFPTPSRVQDFFKDMPNYGSNLLHFMY